jgi:hypothetical protein
MVARYVVGLGEAGKRGEDFSLKELEECPAIPAPWRNLRASPPASRLMWWPPLRSG